MSVLLYKLILKNEPGIVSAMSVVTVLGVVSVIRFEDPVLNFKYSLKLVPSGL